MSSWSSRGLQRATSAVRAMRPMLGLSLLLVTLLAAAPAGEFTGSDRTQILQLSPLPLVLPDPTNRFADDERAASLGRRLFFEPRLSSRGVSCARCHDPQLEFGDRRSVPEPIAGAPVPSPGDPMRRNTPSLIGVAYNRWYFWDGRADTLWAQALFPIENEQEMAGSRVDLARLIATDRSLSAPYQELFGELPSFADADRFPAGARPQSVDRGGPSAIAWERMSDADRDLVDRVFSNAGKAIAAYERRLLPSPSQFDRFVAALRAGSDDSFYPSAARRGLKLFLGRGGCRVCHSGPLFSDGEFHNTAFGPAGYGGTDPGRYAAILTLTHNDFGRFGRWAESAQRRGATPYTMLRPAPEMWGQFKTPSLRNVTRTAPYLHDGSLPTLRAVLQRYSEGDASKVRPANGSSGASLTQAPPSTTGPSGERILRPLHLSEQEIDDLLAFLGTLEWGALDSRWTTPPEDPPR